MTATITITHTITADQCATKVRMPDGTELTKTWRSREDGGYVCDSPKAWEDEPGIPDEVAYALERAPLEVCDLLEDW